MKLKKILLATIKKHLFLFIIGAFISISSVVIALVTPFINQAIIDDGIFANNISVLIILSITLALLHIFEYVMGVLKGYIFTKISKEFSKSVYINVIDNLFHKDHNFFVENSSGDVLQKINEVWDLENAFSEQLLSSVLSIFTFFIAFGVLITLSVPVTILSVVAMIIIGVFYYFGNRVLDKFINKTLDKDVEVTSKTQELILGIFEIRSNAASKLFQENTVTKVNEKNIISIRFATIMPLVFNVPETLMSVLLVGILYLSGVEIMAGTLTFGTYILLVSYSQRVISPIMQVGGIINSLKPIFVLGKRVKEHFSINRCDNISFDKSLQQDIDTFAIKNVSYKYPTSNQNVFENVCLEAKKGDIVLIKGANGSGKSTLLNIICGEIKQDVGSVLFEINEDFPHKYISIVRQRPFIFNLTLCENIILSEPFDEIRYKEVLDILSLEAYFDPKILNNSAEIQENGIALSGGQIKLIALARCLYRKRSILILDEIFSNLDINIRKIILDFIERYKHDYIWLVVEHTNEYDSIANKFINIESFK